MRALRLVLVLASAAWQVAQPATGAVVNGGYAAVVRQAAPSVVTVLVEEQGESAGQRAVERATGDTQYNDMRTFILRMLSGPGNSNPVPASGGSALGSGFIIRADGLIVTNRHVVEGARTVRVKLADDRVIPAQVLGTDATTDIALLRVQAGRLPALRLESSDTVSVGDPVIAIGNPFGLGQTVTAGVLSARARTLGGPDRSQRKYNTGTAREGCGIRSAGVLARRGRLSRGAQLPRQMSAPAMRAPGHGHICVRHISCQSCGTECTLGLGGAQSRKR